MYDYLWFQSYYCYLCSIQRILCANTKYNWCACGWMGYEETLNCVENLGTEQNLTGTKYYLHVASRWFCMIVCKNGGAL